LRLLLPALFVPRRGLERSGEQTGKERGMGCGTGYVGLAWSATG
jgi:hypothetical protein